MHSNGATTLSSDANKYVCCQQGEWRGISVKGETPGSSGIGLPLGTTTIFADNIEGTAHDFTASSYGLVEGIAFFGSATGAMVLNGKTLPRGYGSDITYRDCNFGGGPDAAEDVKNNRLC